MKRVILGLTVLLSVACGIPINPPKPPTPIPPTPPAARTVAIVVTDNYGHVRAGADVQLNDADPPGYHYGITNGDGYVAFNDVSGSLTATDMAVTLPGCVYYTAAPVLATAANQTIRVGTPGSGLKNAPDVNLPALDCTPVIPPPPTRDQVLKVCMSFQGLNVQTSFGYEPYFEASLAWHDKLEDRQAIYAAKHASRNAFCPAGDTHAMVFVPFGKPLYDEGGQFYTADKFPALDWTNGNTAMDPRFVALVAEVRQNGFIPLVVGAEDYSWVDDGKWDAQASLIVHALQSAPAGDLTQHASFMPCFDGCFYGAANDQIAIPRWAATIRTYCPACYLVFEHQTGHIPLGEGPSDWITGGRMQVYDGIYSEFNDDVFDDSVWQIGARLLGPAYVRPPDQPSGDDPRPPNYIPNPNPRGPIYRCAIEFGTYGWVRRQYDAAHVAGQRQYFVNIGYTCGG